MAMQAAIWIAAIGAFPASLAAWAAVIAARRAGVSDPDIAEIKQMLSDHIKDSSIHFQPDSRITNGRGVRP